jgi:hypothetical protein
MPRSKILYLESCQPTTGLIVVVNLFSWKDFLLLAADVVQSRIKKFLIIKPFGFTIINVLLFY